jgi:apolipoprotein N-acyltransferase
VALAIASGVLLALSFPTAGHPAFSWLALTPLLVAVANRTTLRAFTLGWLAGLVYFTGTLYWIANVMALHGGLARWVAVLVNAALIAVLALFPGVFSAAAARLVARFGRNALMAAPLVWVATELARTYVLGGFPWVLLGYSQVDVLPIAQAASVVGVYGVSGLVGSVSAAAARMALATRVEEWRPAVILTALLVVGVAIGGSVRLWRNTLASTGEPVRIGLIQANVDQAEKWDASRAGVIYERHLALTEQAIDQDVDLVIWPESSMPYRYEEEGPASDRLRMLAQSSRVPILLGSNEIAPGDPLRYYNAAFLVNADGTTGGIYRKMQLVPFGEYVPLQSLFFFAAPLTEAVGAFSPGEDATVLSIEGHRISTAICYEVVYPGLVREFVTGGSQLLTTITNDAWFGPTAAPYQHFAQAAMRAIENGRYLVRAANTGISGAVDPYGRVLAESGLFEEAVTIVDVRYQDAVTFYSRFGDWFAWLSVGATVALLVVSRRRVQ